MKIPNTELYYDLHIHSCLSPCGDEDMTPANIVGMAKLKGLDVIALTDHNTCGNCAAVMTAGKAQGLLVLPGMELCTSEEIHVVCLFKELCGALEFSKRVYSVLPEIKNRADIFGEQTIIDENDNILGHEERLLINAAGISIDDVSGLLSEFGGVAFPAHIDKVSNGIIGVLGTFPQTAGFKAAELSSACDKDVFLNSHKEISNLTFLKNSDAHYLWQISERENSVDINSLYVNLL
jgi:PHP family Zn ribbon phosphoesterase